MALDTSLIEAAMADNIAAGDSRSQADAAHVLAEAIVNTIKSATINYTVGLVAPSGGGPVTGTLASATLT